MSGTGIGGDGPHPDDLVPQRRWYVNTLKSPMFWIGVSLGWCIGHTIAAFVKTL